MPDDPGLRAAKRIVAIDGLEDFEGGGSHILQFGKWTVVLVGMRRRLDIYENFPAADTDTRSSHRYSDLPAGAELYWFAVPPAPDRLSASIWLWQPLFPNSPEPWETPPCAQALHVSCTAYDPEVPGQADRSGG